MTDRELDLLHALAVRTGWSRPMDVGGTGKNNHSRVLTRLHRKGLVDVRKRMVHRGAKSNRLYRINDAGWKEVDKDTPPEIDLHECGCPFWDDTGPHVKCDVCGECVLYGSRHVFCSPK